jgi:hypothetical protein
VITAAPTQQKIRIRLRAYDHRMLDDSLAKIVDTAVTPRLVGSNVLAAMTNVVVQATVDIDVIADIIDGIIVTTTVGS